MPYVRTDYSANCALSVSHPRSSNPAGCLIHTTSGTDSLSWLAGGSADAGTPAGADALIRRNGDQFILTKPDRFAYHAGNSYVYLNGDNFGDEVSELLIGIELECLVDQAPTYEQYDSLGELVVLYSHLWGWRWPFIIYGHYAVARPLGRRSDPVNFDWGSFMGRLYVHSVAGKVPGLIEP